MANTVDTNVSGIEGVVKQLHNSIIELAKRLIAIKEGIASGDYSLVVITVPFITEVIKRRDIYAAITPSITVRDEAKILTPNFYSTWTNTNRQDLNGVVNDSVAVRQAIVDARNRAPTTGAPNSFDATFDPATFAYLYNTAAPADVTALEAAIDNVLRNNVLGYDMLP